MSETIAIEDLEQWAVEDKFVAVHLRQQLVPIEGPGGVFFPPTYADVGYQTNTLHDGTLMVEVDSVGSQSNRMEPIFARPELDGLVPNVRVRYGDDEELSILEASHRLGDAVVRSTDLHEDARAAFLTFLRSGDATAIAKLAPTSLVFGAWDSRDTMAKIPRIVQGCIRAYDIVPLERSAQFNPALDYAALDVFSESDKEKAEGKTSGPLAERGFVHVPAVNSHGGVIAHGRIQRDVTVNLVQLRRLNADDPAALRNYILGLALVAALEPMDPFLRQGCVLVPDVEVLAEQLLIHRKGVREEIQLDPSTARSAAKKAADRFGVGPDRRVDFDKSRAVADTKTAKK